MTTVGLLSPGAMGSSVGAAALGQDDKVIWASEGRSSSSIDRAAKAGLTDCGTLDALFAQSDIVLSVGPPHNATDIAQEANQHRFTGIYLDANAIAPKQCRLLRYIVCEHGATFVDGGIIGGPAWHKEAGTRLWLSGDAAPVIADLFNDSPLHTGFVSNEIGAASALKMTFSAFTKGSTALLSAILAVAEKEGVRDHLQTQWGENFTRQTQQRVINNSAKAWRFEGEMREIAATFEDAGLPPGFFESATDVYARLGGYKDWQEAPGIDDLLNSLLGKDANDS
jgi:3-hydroxyisobutyrate dehydrogenase-like beta-hydroxyacid dehydrogenase